jgi:hypothetical protein
MSTVTVTANSIALLSADTLIRAVSLIETKLAGWWWSLSQESGRITLSAGAGRNCPNPVDVALSRTREGDAGVIESICFTQGDREELVIEFIEAYIMKMDAHRESIKSNSPELIPEPNENWYRKQYSSELIDLRNRYYIFLTSIPVIESLSIHRLNEFYIGSCDLSADCSIRGTIGENEKFDFSVDLAGQDISIADSVELALFSMLETTEGTKT